MSFDLLVRRSNSHYINPFPPWAEVGKTRKRNLAHNSMKGLIFKETVVLRRWGIETSVWFVNRVEYRKEIRVLTSERRHSNFLTVAKLSTPNIHTTITWYHLVVRQLGSFHPIGHSQRISSTYSKGHVWTHLMHQIETVLRESDTQ